MSKGVSLLFLIFLSYSVYSASHLKTTGTYNYTWFGFDVYQAVLKTEGKGVSLKQELELTLIYQRDFEGIKIAKQSDKELKGLGVSKTQRDKWFLVMKDIFPDIKKGESITAKYVPDEKISFYLNKTKLLGEVKDKKFAIKFIGIWLDPMTSEPKMRKILFGDKI